MTHTIKHSGETFVFFISQTFSFFFIGFLFDILLKPRIEMPEGLTIPQGTLIVSNHQSWIDPWALIYFLGPQNIIPLLPMRFPVTHNFFRKTIMGSILWCLGGFNIGSTPLEKAKKLLYIRNLIHQKYSVLIFPEGKWVQNIKERFEFKRGIHMLVHEDTPILLVQLSNLKNNLFTYKFRRSGIRIKYSRLINSGSASEKIKLIHEFYGIHDKV